VIYYGEEEYPLQSKTCSKSMDVRALRCRNF
jgi:hypothetical protein